MSVCHRITTCQYRTGRALSSVTPFSRHSSPWWEHFTFEYSNIDHMHLKQVSGRCGHGTTLMITGPSPSSPVSAGLMHVLAPSSCMFMVSSRGKYTEVRPKTVMTTECVSDHWVITANMFEAHPTLATQHRKNCQ